MGRAGLLILKWVLVPAALALVGYYLLGPMISQGAMPGSRTVKKLAGRVGVSPDVTPGQPTNPANPLESSEADGPKFPEPEVEVTVVDQGKVRWSAGSGGGASASGSSGRRRRESSTRRPYRPAEDRAATDTGAAVATPSADQDPPAQPPSEATAPAESSGDAAGAGGEATPPPPESTVP